MATFLTIAFSIAIGMGMMICFTVWGLLSSYKAGLWLVIAYTVVYVFTGINPGLNLGINLYVGDLVFLAIGGSAFARFVFVRGEIQRHALWIAYGGMLLLSFVRGVSSFGPSAPGNDLREFYYFFATALYFSSFRYQQKDVDSVVSTWGVFAMIIFLIVTLRWIVDATGIDIGIDPRTWAALKIGVTRLRVVQASSALVLAYAVVMLAFGFFRRDKTSPITALLFLLFLLYVIVLQHRSVWISTVVGLAVVLMLQQRNRARSIGQLLAAGVVLVAVMLPLSMTGQLERVSKDLGASVEEATRARGSTFTWRLQGAAELTKDLFSSGPVAIAVGKPMGSGYDRTVADSTQEVTVAPHNYYVQVLLRVGLIGLGIFLLSYVGAIRGLMVAYRDGSTAVDARPLIALLAVQLTYLFPYGGTPPLAIILGLAFSVAAAARVTAVASSSPGPLGAAA